MKRRGVKVRAPKWVGKGRLPRADAFRHAKPAFARCVSAYSFRPRRSPMTQKPTIPKRTTWSLSPDCLIPGCDATPARSGPAAARHPFGRRCSTAARAKQRRWRTSTGTAGSTSSRARHWYEAPSWTKHPFRELGFSEQVHRRLQRSAGGRRWRRLRRHRLGDLVCEEGLLVPQPGQGVGAWVGSGRSTPGSTSSSPSWPTSTTTARRRRSSRRRTGRARRGA